MQKDRRDLMQHNYILKLPHYLCVEKQLYFLDKKFCELSDGAASLYQELSYQLNEMEDYKKEAVDELVKTKSVMTCSLSEKMNPDAPLILVIAPHLDDAAFSVGGLLTRLSKNYRIHILTLFSIDPYSIYKGLKHDFVRLQNLRTAEENAVASLIKASTYQLKWKDALLRGYKDFYEPIGKDEPMDQYVKEILNVMPEKPHLVLCPLGLSHVDHRLTRQLMDRVNEMKYNCQIPMMYYEDLPYACSEFTDPEYSMSYCVHLSEYEIEHKKKMINTYISQLSPGLTARLLNYREGKECIWCKENELQMKWIQETLNTP